MLSYAFYNLVHIVGLILLMMGLGGLALAGGTGGEAPARWPGRLLALIQGSGLFLILLGGFGLLARLGVAHGGGWPAWVWVKFGVWVMLGLAAVAPFWLPRTARPLLLIVPALGALAAYMAIYKPI
jgi:hypothetical protein